MAIKIVSERKEPMDKLMLPSEAAQLLNALAGDLEHILEWVKEDAYYGAEHRTVNYADRIRYVKGLLENLGVPQK